MLLVPLLFSPFPIFWTFLKAAGRKPFSSSAITLPSTRSSVKRIEINTERSRLHTNWHFTRTVYHWSLVLRSFRAKPKLIEDDANGFLKLFITIPASLNSWPPVQKSESCACANTWLRFFKIIDIQSFTTVFVDTWLWKSKHPRERFQNFRQSYVLLTDRIEIHQSQPASMT